MLARCRNAPSTPFFITAAIPLIPGSTLYYCMNAVVSNDLPAAEHFGEQTFLAALGIAGGMACLFGMILPPMAVLAVITQFYTAFQSNLWVAAAMRGIRAAVVPIMISAVIGMVGSAFRFPPCYAVMLLVIALYLFLNVNCVYLVVIGAVCGLLIAEFYERKGAKKHDGAA